MAGFRFTALRHWHFSLFPLVFLSSQFSILVPSTETHSNYQESLREVSHDIEVFSLKRDCLMMRQDHHKSLACVYEQLIITHINPSGSLRTRRGQHVLHRTELNLTLEIGRGFDQMKVALRITYGDKRIAPDSDSLSISSWNHIFDSTSDSTCACVRVDLEGNYFVVFS